MLCVLLFLENSVKETKKQCVQQEAPVVVPLIHPWKERVALDLSSTVLSPAPQDSIDFIPACICSVVVERNPLSPSNGT